MNYLFFCASFFFCTLSFCAAFLFCVRILHLTKFEKLDPAETIFKTPKQITVDKRLKQEELEKLLLENG